MMKLGGMQSATVAIILATFLWGLMPCRPQSPICGTVKQKQRVNGKRMAPNAAAEDSPNSQIPAEPGSYTSCLP
jgi:hypothetical protein